MGILFGSGLMYNEGKWSVVTTVSKEEARMKRLTSVFPLVVLIAAVGFLPACGASEPAVPTGPPVIKSFTVEDETIGPGEAPRFLFEVENARAITIRQDGEVVFEIEATAPPGTEGASRLLLGNPAYALPAGGSQTDHPYPAGVFPASFTGASTGKPALDFDKWFQASEGAWVCRWNGQSNFGDQGWWDGHCEYRKGVKGHSVWTFGGEGDQHAIGVQAELEARSLSGDVATTKTAFGVVSAAGETAGQEAPITINSFTTPKTTRPDEAPVYSFDITAGDDCRVTMEQDGVVFYDQQFTGPSEAGAACAGCPVHFVSTCTGPIPEMFGIVTVGLTVASPGTPPVVEERRFESLCH